ncbi:MAG TPA: sugar ABC transporter ATP-binding protein [Chloroflexus aurantiacus]|uniref:ABC transporter related n=1 Tax=Chloroflexus aurantiacus (strain ATCC 29366 / DSM 635 / J-10-fl) TaxID=324602 RepID=A9WGG6_CHLAA|nr:MULTISPECIES: sugar ABC transporter ATP-binding protein [Chloroflexus]ABY35498.1 ABC transporter related [Chloroflexus aurantiacus J-10-fl]HBW69451.1 sugar ABC transporter ATP-binding protein [Chloroflexus aurantiacus]
MQVSPVLEIRDISRRFGNTQALDGVSLRLYPGEVHALLGENGAGKSTLIKIMTGVYQPDSGQILLDGRPVHIGSTLAAQRLGIAAIYQEPLMYPDLNVAENIFIAHAGRGPFVDWGRMYREAEALLAQLDVRLDVRLPARGLSVAAQQTVEIAKALALQVRVLIMDEPTAALSAHEVEQLFAIVRRLRDQGVAILFISHRMEEVFAIADRITVFRDGRLISSAPRAEVTPEQAIRDMAGRSVEQLFPRRHTVRDQVLVEVRDLSRQGAFQGISFDVRAGEVLGFAGLVGARRTDVGLALFGIAPADSGTVRIDGQLVRITNPRQAMRHGIAYVSEDRRGLGLSLPMSIAANITLPTLRRYLNPLGLLRQADEIATAEAYRQRLAIRAPSVAVEVGKLSGGNQQKVMLSKWLNTRPRLLILDEPTRGIDVGAKAEVHQMIDDLAAEGIAIILISSDLPEVLAMSDRVLVMREGRQMAIFSRQEATQERVLAAAMGQMYDGMPVG